jgi:hypothetical protein
MPTWLFLLVILAIGLFLAIYVDRLKGRPGSGPGEPPPARERSRWLYYWYLGRFPDKAEEEEDERKRQRKD